MLKYQKLVDNYFWLVIILLSLPAIWALTVPGFYGASDDLHVGWLDQMVKLLQLGQIPPRFAPDLSYGFGYPLFNFVFPLPFYLGALFHAFGLSLVDSVKMVFGLSLSLSAITMYLFLRRVSDSWIALVGSLVYLYTPYRSTDVYVRGAFGESLAFVFFPLILLAADQLISRSTKSWIAIGGLSIAGLVLSHNIATYMFLPFAGLFVILKLLIERHSWQRIVPLFASGILGLTISLYFWLPALVESGLMKYDTVFDIRDHFPTLRQLFTPFWGYGASVPGPYDGMSFFLGLFNVVLLIIAPLILVTRWRQFEDKQKTVIVWGVVTVLISIALMNFRSTPIWQTVPLMPYFQFPWRFLMMTTFASSVLITCLINLPKRWLISNLLIVLVIIVNAYQFRPHDFLGRTDHYYLDRYIPAPEASEQYKTTQEEYLRLMKTTQTRPSQNYPLAEINPGTVQNQATTLGLKTNLQVEAGPSAVLQYYKYNFPGWQAKIDGQQVAIKDATPFGNLEFSVPEGTHHLEISFKETSCRMITNVVSLLSLLLALWLALFGGRMFETIRRSKR